MVKSARDSVPKWTGSSGPKRPTAMLEYMAVMSPSSDMEFMTGITWQEGEEKEKEGGAGRHKKKNTRSVSTMGWRLFKA